MRAALMIGFVFLGYHYAENAVGHDSIRWMWIFHPGDFPSLRETLRFLHDLQVPIPPLIALAEILNWRWLENTEVVNIFLYRLALVSAYLLTIFLAGRSLGRLLTAFALSAIFLVGTTLVHPGNPMNYDIFFPFFFMGFIVAYDRLGDPARGAQSQAFFCLLAGLSLSLAELTRPFMIFLLPLLLWLTALRLKPCGGRMIAAFLLPVLLFSGLWHAHLALVHGRLAWTNNSGFNLMRAWTTTPWPALQPESHDAPVRPRRWQNLNTDEHAENSARLQKAVLTHIVTHPGKSLAHGGRRLFTTVTATTSIYDHKPANRVLRIYRLAVLATAAWLLLNFALLGCLIIRGPNRLRLLAETSGMTILSVSLILLMVSLGEGGEEARFMISILPMLALLPRVHHPRGGCGS